MTHADTLLESINRHKARIGVIGLGYVGLPLLKSFSGAGFPTIGFDVDTKKVEMLLAGKSYIKHHDPAWFREGIADGTFVPTADMGRLSEADAILICVPTPLTDSRDPDLTYVEKTTESIAKALRPGQLVVLESTTYPGTTRDICLPILAKSGLEVGKDYFLAFSPEREDPGNPNFSTGTIPKVVGGIDETSLTLADALYRQAVSQTVPVGSCEVAEACKILENTYRSVNIAMVNELKKLFDRLGINIWEVIEAAKTKPFGFQAFYPGPGLGGHCIPIDPFYLSWLARRAEMPARFIELAGEINADMPHYVLEKIGEALNDHGKPIRGSKIGILGVAYKKDIDDPRESPSFRVMELLAARGADLSYNDPHVEKLPSMRHYKVLDLTSEPLSAEYLAACDAVVILTDHSAYDPEMIVKNAKLVVDTRNLTRAVATGREKIYRA